MARKNFIFTNKEQSLKGILSCVLGAVSVIALAAAVIITFKERMYAPTRFGATALLALLFAIAGIILAVIGKMESDSFHLSCWVGLILNIFVIACISFILYAGAYGL